MKKLLNILTAIFNPPPKKIKVSAHAGRKIRKLDQKIEMSGDFEFTVDEFSNIANVAADKMKASDPVEKDAIARLLLLNIEIGYKKSPFLQMEGAFCYVDKSTSCQFWYR